MVKESDLDVEELSTAASSRNEKLIIAFLAVIGLFVSGFFGWLMEVRSITVVQEDNVGSVVNIDYRSSLGVGQTKIETTKGFYLVAGTIDVSKDIELVLETRKNGDRFLCTTEPVACHFLKQ